MSRQRELVLKSSIKNYTPPQTSCPHLILTHCLGTSCHQFIIQSRFEELG